VPESRISPDLDVPEQLVRLMFAVGAAYDDASRELGLSSQQARLLCAAGRLPKAGLGDLAAVMRCDRSNVSRLVERVEKRGLVARQGTESDGRVTRVALSDDGQQLVERFTDALESRLKALVADWPRTEQQNAARILRTLTDALNRRPEPEPEPEPSDEAARSVRVLPPA
jgi:DNA-binding MarR family transcriptional regulator